MRKFNFLINIFIFFSAYISKFVCSDLNPAADTLRLILEKDSRLMI